MPGPTYATFGPLTQTRGFDFTFGPGIQPSVCMLYTVPHTPGLPSVAPLTFKTEGEAPFVFPDCLLEQPRLDAGGSGQHWTLPIKDRRWKWQFGYIHGSYNIPRPDGTLLRERTPNALAGICLAAMGETDWDTSRIPGEPRPERQWNGQNPAAELDRLCAELGCVVVLNWITNKVEIWPEGDGTQLTGAEGPTRGKAYAPIQPPVPQKIRTESGPALFQALFRTEAVGLDTDGKWKPIDQLSYTPAGGWSLASIAGGFPEVTGTYTDLNGRLLQKRDLAAGTVFKNYRISGLAQGGWVPPILAGTPFAPTSLRDFRLHNFLVDEEIAPDGGLRQLDPVAYVRQFVVGLGTQPNPIRYQDGFYLDTQHGIVRFNEAAFLVAAGGQFLPATVRIECAFNCGAEGVMNFAFLETNAGAIATPARVVQRHEIIPRIIYRYSDDNTFSREDNLTDVNTRLTHWQTAALAEYELQNGGTVNYQRLVPLNCDGLTQQITWSGGGGRPGTTIASQAQRHNRFVQSLDEYRDRVIARLAGEALVKFRPLVVNAQPSPFEAGA